MTARSSRWVALCASIALFASGCGGGSSDTAATNDSAQPPATAAQIIGTAATGAALGNAPVAITNSSGASPCTEASITTTPLGSYTCTLKDGETAPFFVVVTDPTGNTPPLVSISTVTPAAGAALTVNATPLTTAIVAQLSADGNALSVVGKAVDAATLEAITENVLAQLAPVLASIGLDAGYDPFSTSITAATADNTGNTADLVLDIVKVVTDPATGKLALATVDNPTPVVLATATSTGATLPAPDASVSTLSQAAQLAARKFNDCFALPKAQRVLGTTDHPASDGGPEVDAVGSACQDFVADAGNAGGVDYLHNGYSAGQQFYGILTADRMTGAKFSVPEIMAFYPKSASAVAPAPDAYDRAVLNFRYVDSEGNPNNAIAVAARLPGTSSAERPTEWWLVGNQQPVDVGPSIIVRRVEQMNPSNTARFSTFQTGFLFNVNAKGPGSVDASGTMTLARISGPGLPGNGADGTGLVFKVSSEASQAFMDVYNKTGNLTSGSQCGNNMTFNCPLIWISRTKGLTGTDATTLATNPNNMLWAQPSDGFDPSKFVKGARYKVELFYGSNTTTPLHTVYKTLLSDMVAATSLVNLPWSAPGPKTLAAFDPNGPLAGVQTALAVDWVQNPAAQQMRNVGAVIDAFGSYGPNTEVPPGATSVVLGNTTVPALTTSTSRNLKFNYRTQDTSVKSAVYQYN